MCAPIAPRWSLSACFFRCLPAVRRSCPRRASCLSRCSVTSASPVVPHRGGGHRHRDRRPRAPVVGVLGRSHAAEGPCCILAWGARGVTRRLLQGLGEERPSSGLRPPSPRAWHGEKESGEPEITLWHGEKENGGPMDPSFSPHAGRRWREATDEGQESPRCSISNVVSFACRSDPGSRRWREPGYESGWFVGG